MMDAHLLMAIVLVATMQLVWIADAYGPMAKPNCPDKCGDVVIPFPFGIGAGCFRNHWYEIECKKTTSNPNGSTPSKPYIAKFSNIEVMKIDVESASQSSLLVGIPPLQACGSETAITTSINFTGSPYTLSTDSNIFMVEGCSGSAVSRDKRKNIMAGCGTICGDSNTPPQLKSGCSGVECCQSIVSTITNTSNELYHIDAYPQVRNSSGGETQNCLTATLISSDFADQYKGKISSSAVAPVELLWRYEIERKDGTKYISNGFCQITSGVLVCSCDNGCYGNPYVSNGCQVRQECKGCLGICYQFYDYKARTTKNSYYCGIRFKSKLPAILGLSFSFGLVVLVIGLYGLYRFIRRRKEIKRKAKFFKRNGGLLLHQQLASNEGIVEGTLIFTASELDKATDHFNENWILGQGGQGTVYKGMLVDGRIVAIKKAKLLDESQLQQFINEVVILSQINHRNVVKLMGCCLETEVPLLVYEFVPNGTLFQHIHEPEEDFAIGWEKRLKIVLDSASAIAYLHSSSSIPIYHRDIKSSNILLDERHRAKVSDFGSSKTIAIDQTHLTTLVQGTLGYLDPEYFQTYQFTDKSDVYSFGVVLLEILTSKKPIYRDASSMEQKNLVTEFLSVMEQSTLFDILDPEVVREAKVDELTATVKLATHCINRSGKLRPTMKEVAMTLEMIIKSPAQFSSLFQQHEALGSAENTITETSLETFMPNSLPSAVLSPLYNDVKPHLLDTI